MQTQYTYSLSVPPSVVPVVREVIGNESMSATLQFRIENADPQVLLSGLRWYYSRTFVNDLSHQTVVEITNETNRTSVSLLVTSFSSDGEFFNLTIENIAQDRIGGEEADAGRYFLQATNPAGTSFAFIDLEVFGMLPPFHSFSCQSCIHNLPLTLSFRATGYYPATCG